MPVGRPNRRAFIAALGGAAAWPLAARAQQDRVRLVAQVLGGGESDPLQQARVAALQKGLRDAGWAAGRNIRFDVRWDVNNRERAQADAAELVTLAPDVIVSSTLPGILALRQAMPSTPIVFTDFADPVGTGLVSNLARPGGNITGFTAYEFSIAAKWVEVLKEISPSVTRVGFIFGTQRGPTGQLFYHALEGAASALSIEPTAIQIGTPAELESAIAEFALKPNGGLAVAAEGGAAANRALIIQLATRLRLPAIYPASFYAAEGGLASYGIDFISLSLRAASYVDRILRGANPASLPVQAPDKFELVINLKTARAQGIDIPPVLLTRADEVIE